MGIQGLLQSLRPIQRSINISEYRGKTVAVDGHCILHRGGFGAATKLALNQPTDSYVNYFMQFMGLLEYHGVKPIVVFDGLPLPLKQITNDERRRNRQTALKQGLELYEQGKIAAAEKFFQQSVSITSEMIIAVIRKLMEKKIECIVAPNEADAQLTHLSKTGKVDAIVTEDSDLLAFGCSKVIYKIDRYGDGVEICMDKVINDYRSTLYEYDAETIRHICILSGCDYLPSVKGVGLKTILKRYEINKNTDQALYHLQHHFKKDFPRDYIEKFYFANLGFLHQWVYDLDEKNYVRLNPLPEECTEEDVKLLGRIPTVQDSTMFRVNKVIPRPKPKESPLKVAITEEFLTYTDTAKENIMPAHMGTPFTTPSPKSPKSPKSPTSSMGVTARRVLAELKLPHHSSNTINVAAESTSGEPSSSMSRPHVPTQGERLEALYKRYGVLPRKSRQLISETSDSANNKTAPSTNSTTYKSKPTISKYEKFASLGIKKMFPGTDIELAANLPTVYAKDRDSWMSYLKQKCTPPSPQAAVPSKVKSVFHRMKSKKNASEAPLTSPPHSPISPPPSIEQQPLMPSNETATTSTTLEADIVESTQADADNISQGDADKTKHADIAEATHGYPISPPQTSPTGDEMPSITTNATSPDTTAIVDNIETSIPKIAHSSDQKSNELNTQQPSSSTPSELNNASHNQHTRPKPAGKWSQIVHTPTSSGHIPSSAHTNFLRSNTTSSNSNHTTLYKQHTQANKPTITKRALPVNTPPPPPPPAHISHTTDNDASYIEEELFVDSQYSLVKFIANHSPQSVQIEPSSDLLSPFVHIRRATSNATRATAATPSNSKPLDTASVSGKHEQVNAGSSSSSSSGIRSQLRDSKHGDFQIPTHAESSSEGTNKRSFDQTEHTATTIQGNRAKKHIPAHPFTSKDH